MPTKTFYADAATEADISYLVTDFHQASFSTIVQMAIHEAAETRRRAALRREAEQIRNDPTERAAAQSLAAEMEEYSVW